MDKDCLFLASNAGRQARLKAGARQLGKDKAQCLAACFLLLPVENRPCHFHGLRLNTCAQSPWRSHEALGPIAPGPQASTRVPLACALGTFVPLFSQARGLRPQSSSWCAQLAWAQTPRPPPTLRQGVGVSLGAPWPPGHSPAPPLRRLPGSAWQPQTARARGRVALLAPSALGGSPVCGQRGAPVDRCHLGSRLREAVVRPLTARG
jgi:hypothetical protein